MNRLLSRKFLLALSAATTFIANKQYPEALGAVLGYLAIQGVIDFKETPPPEI